MLTYQHENFNIHMSHVAVEITLYNFSNKIERQFLPGKTVILSATHVWLSLEKKFSVFRLQIYTVLII